MIMQFCIQTSEYADQITPDGTELTKLPYPFYVDEGGNVGRQDFWQGTPERVIGFARDLSVQEISLWWPTVVQDPAPAVGMYLVTQDADGSVGAHPTAVSSIKVVEEK
jgi:hypothetical protein